MVEVMVVMATSFKGFMPICPMAPRTIVFSAPDPVAGHCQPTCPLENSVHSQASLAQFLVELLLLSPGSWFTQGFVCALQSVCFPSPVYVLGVL